MGLSNILKMFGSKPDTTAAETVGQIGPKPKRTPSMLKAYRIKRDKAKKVAYASRRTNMLRK